MTSRKSAFALLAIYLAAAATLALGHTALALLLVLVFLAVDRAARSFHNANAFMSTLFEPTARHAADDNERKDQK